MHMYHYSFSPFPIHANLSMFSPTFNQRVIKRKRSERKEKEKYREKEVANKKGQNGRKGGT